MKMDFSHVFQPRQRRLLSTRRRMKILLALNSECKACLLSDKDSGNDEENIFKHRKEVMAFLQSEQVHVEHLKELRQCLMNPVLKDVELIDDIIRLVDEMLSTHDNLCSSLIYGKVDMSDSLKQLSSCLDAYISYSLLVNLEKNNFQEIFGINDKICMDIDILQEPIAYISRCKTLFQNLCNAVPEETYHSTLKTIEEAHNNIQNELSVRRNAIRTLQIQRMLFNREPKILCPGRTVLKEGILYKIHQNGNGMKQRVFFLFNDIFLCCKMLSKTFDWKTKDSLLFCSLFPLNTCTVSLVMGSSNQGALFKVTCGTMSCLLISKIPGEAFSWFQELQNAIQMSQKPNAKLKPKLNRKRGTGLKQRISPFLKQSLKSNNDLNNADDKVSELLNKQSSFRRVKRFLICTKNR